MGLPGQKIINGLLLAALVVGGVILAINNDVNDLSQPLFIAMLVVAALLGLGVVMPIGGADMPVVISLLNAFTGLSAAAAGIALDNTALIVAGTGRFLGHDPHPGNGDRNEPVRRQHPLLRIRFDLGRWWRGPGTAAIPFDERPGRRDPTRLCGLGRDRARLRSRRRPGQHTVKEMADELQKKGVTVNYAIHPVAGRMPGHMNVLLAEADVPYDQLKEMDEINPELPQTDVCVVIGANDVTNPAAKTDESSPIYGMPIIEVDEAQQVLVLKRSMSAGFAGIDNDLFYNEKTAMVFGDAKHRPGHSHRARQPVNPGQRAQDAPAGAWASSTPGNGSSSTRVRSRPFPGLFLASHPQERPVHDPLKPSGVGILRDLVFRRIAHPNSDLDRNLTRSGRWVWISSIGEIHTHLKTEPEPGPGGATGLGNTLNSPSVPAVYRRWVG